MLDAEELPLVTVVTVTYNSAKFVRDAIGSVLRQNYSAIEYIIGDDSSTDETWAVISEYKDERIVAYRNETNLGEYHNRNKALSMARGKYFIFIDGDDIMYPHAVSTFVIYMEKYPEACMAVQKGYYNDLVLPILLGPIELYKNYFFGKHNLLMSSFASNFFRTELLRVGKLATQYYSGDDEIRLRLAASNPVLFVPGWMTWPRETPGQASSKIPVDKGFLQSFEYISVILKGDNMIAADAKLCREINMILKEQAVVNLLHMIKNCQFKDALSFKKRAGVKWSQLNTINATKFKNVDVFDGRSPGSPYRQDFR